LLLFAALSDEDKSKVNTYLARIADGDVNALSELYKLVGGRLLAVAHGIMRNRFSAEDVLHDSFIKAVKYSKQFSGGNGYAWLCKIVKNTALNKLKSERIRRADNIDDIFDLSIGNDMYYDYGVSSDVKKAMLRLTPQERLAVWLKYYNDMTVREIAEDMNLKKSTAQDLIKSAEQKLLRILRTDSED